MLSDRRLPAQNLIISSSTKLEFNFHPFEMSQSDEINDEEWYCKTTAALVEELKKRKEEVAELKKEVAEYEAVEIFIMTTLRNGGSYDDILPAHYREGEVVDGKWKNKDDEDYDDDDDDEDDCEPPAKRHC